MSKKDQNLINLHKLVDGKERKYNGRFLGFIKDDEFNALIQNTKEVAPRLESKATQPLMEIVSKFDNMKGYRLVMTVRKIDKDDTLKKMLLVTEGLEMIDTVVPKTKNAKNDLIGQVTFQTADQDIIVVQEAG